MSGGGEQQPGVNLRIAEPGPLGLTFAVLQAGNGASHDFDVRLITGDPAARSSSALGGLQLDDTLRVTGVEASRTRGNRYSCRTVDGKARILYIGDFSISLCDNDAAQRRSGTVTSYSIASLLEWGVGPEVPGDEDPYIFVQTADGSGLKLRTSDPAAICEAIMERAESILLLQREHGKGFLAQLRNAYEIAWHSGARVGQRLVAVNGTPVETLAEVDACLQAIEDSAWIVTLTLGSGPVVIGSIDPDDAAIRAEPDRLQCGLRLIAVNGQPVAGRSFSAMTKQIREDPRPLQLQLQAPPPVKVLPRIDSSDPEVSEGDREMLKHVEAAQIEHVTNGMVLAKRDGTSYEQYLCEKMPDDYSNEFVTFERNNERYHKMWDEISAETELAHRCTDPETNDILQDAICGVQPTCALSQ